jgi:hypothetical protein
MIRIRGCAFILAACGGVGLGSSVSGAAEGLPYRVEWYKPMHESVTFAPTKPGDCGVNPCSYQFNKAGVQLRSLDMPIWSKLRDVPLT